MLNEGEQQEKGKFVRTFTVGEGISGGGQGGNTVQKDLGKEFRGASS